MLRLNVHLPFAAQEKRWRNREKILASAQKELLFFKSFAEICYLVMVFHESLKFKINLATHTKIIFKLGMSDYRLPHSERAVIYLSIIVDVTIFTDNFLHENQVMFSSSSN